MRSRIVGTVLATLFLIASAYGNAVFTLGQNLNPPRQQADIGTETGMTINGTTGVTGTIVRFHSNTNILMGTSGHAGIISVSPSAFIHNVTISVPGFFFSSILIDPAKELVPGDITVIVRLTGGVVDQFKYPGTSGNNFLTITTANGELISSVTINSPQGFTTLDHTRFSAAPGEFEPVPEPSTLLSFGTGLIGLAGMMRRKLKLWR